MPIERRTRPADRRKQAAPGAAPAARLVVKKTWKMYVGGAFVRSESGRTTEVRDADGHETHNVARASRKDGRDAVSAALAAFPRWSATTAYLRGQVLYRVAEVLESRATELESGLVRALGVAPGDARREVAASVDRAVSWAGWTDKFQSLFASANPVAGPHFGFTVPEPIGVVAIVAPSRPSLLGLVSTVLPVIAAGNAAVVLASEADPRTAVTLAEVFATSDVPGGVVNVLTGPVGEVAPHLARHLEVDALDLWGIDAPLARTLEEDAAGGVKRVRRRAIAADAWFDDERATSPSWIEPWVELKTIWHPVGV